MARTWAMELARADVTVNAVVPNAATAMTETIPFLAAVRRARGAASRCPPVACAGAASFGTPEDVAGLIVYLASDASAASDRPGDRDRRRPALAVVAPGRDPQRLHGRRLEPDAIAEAFDSTVGEVPETYGIEARKLPEPQDAEHERALRPRRASVAHRRRHAHPRARPTGAAAHSLPDELRAGADKYFGADGGGPPRSTSSPPTTASATWPRSSSPSTPRRHRRTPGANEEVVEGAPGNPDVLIPFASIDPAKGRAGVAEARRLVEEHGVRGFKFHPSVQALPPQRPRGLPALRGARRSSACPALFHSGQTGIGAGLPGGGGIRLKYSNPLALDDVAVDFPDLTIIIAHPSFPWQDEALAVATHKPNVYIDLSGWSPKYFPPQLVRYANSLLKHKVLFGSDFPLISPDRWLADFATLDRSRTRCGR